MPPPILARVLAGRAWTYAVGSAAGLGLTAAFAALVDAGWGLEDSLLGAVIAGALLALAGILVRTQAHTRQGSP